MESLNMDTNTLEVRAGCFLIEKATASVLDAGIFDYYATDDIEEDAHTLAQLYRRARQHGCTGIGYITDALDAFADWLDDEDSRTWPSMARDILDN